LWAGAELAVEVLAFMTRCTITNVNKAHVLRLVGVTLTWIVLTQTTSDVDSFVLGLESATEYSPC